MNSFLKAPAPGFDDPLGLLGACHGRILERLDTLERLPGHLHRQGPDKTARQAAERILAYFDKAAPHHHADEDKDLFPMLLDCRGRPGWDARLPLWLERLADEHPVLEQGWAQLRPLLVALAAGDREARPQAARWIDVTRDHLALENACVIPLARRLLHAGELRTLGRAMAVRRNVDYPDG